jgi:hypothetical protein
MIMTCKEEFTATQAQIEKCCRLAWALTIYCCQGANFDGRVRLHDLRNHYFSPTHLYVATSRCTDPSKLECVE